MESRRRKWYCAQIGAREHFAIARALNRDGRLQKLYTDFWAGSFTRFAAEKLGIKGAKSLGARYHGELANGSVDSWNLRSLAWEAGLRHRWNRGGNAGPYRGFVEVGQRFAKRVRNALRKEGELKGNGIFFTYDTGALEALEWCRERGVRSVVDQMDPNRIEVQLVSEEEKRWPGWTTGRVEVPEEYFRRREQEWALADRVMVNSEFCAKALEQQGVPREKLVVVPLSYEPEQRPKEKKGRQASGGPLRVLWLGQVILRKGIQYLMEAARKLEDVKFDIVGPVGISKEALATAPANMRFHGRANRSEARGWYEQADVFVLPTLSDGFAITQLEAMAHGLPIVATPCCGTVMSEGEDGFLVEPRDPESLARALRRYVMEPGLLEHQRQRALVKSREFTLDRLSANLAKLEAVL
jgi:glycosyltransferase involved in cell wall biosynthesis